MYKESLLKRVEKTQYNSIDLIKVCMAIVVVAIHTRPQNSCCNLYFRETIGKFYELTVPFFFVTSGFFLWNKVFNASIDEKLHRLKGWIKKTARLYVAWTLIYMPFTVYGFYKDDLSPIKSAIMFLRNFLLVGENYLSWPLWYLLAMLVAGCIIYLMTKWKWKFYTMCFTGLVFAVVGIFINFCINEDLLSSITSIYISLFKTTRNGFFEGLPYILIGMFIAQKGVINTKKILLVILVAGLFFHIQGYKLATFIVVYSFFSLVIQFDLNDLYLNLRYTSAIVYFVHMVWVGLISILFSNLLPPVYLFLVAVFLSIATAMMVTKKKNLSVVKFLFG